MARTKNIKRPRLREKTEDPPCRENHREAIIQTLLNECRKHVELAAKILEEITDKQQELVNLTDNIRNDIENLIDLVSNAEEDVNE
jgi:hypothetical protein